jgi:hypothetical protein
VTGTLAFFSSWKKSTNMGAFSQALRKRHRTLPQSLQKANVPAEQIVSARAL